MAVVAEVVTYGSLISACEAGKQWELAMQLLADMQEQKVAAWANNVCVVGRSLRYIENGSTVVRLCKGPRLSMIKLCTGPSFMSYFCDNLQGNPFIRTYRNHLGSGASNPHGEALSLRSRCSAPIIFDT